MIPPGPTYLGGSSGFERGTAIAVDSLGHAYVTGATNSPDFPTTPDKIQGFSGTFDVFVTKLDLRGGLVYGNGFDSQGSVGPEWIMTNSDARPGTSTTPSGRTFLGQFDNLTVQLTLSNLPVPSLVAVSFELFIICSWDGAAGTPFGPDRWDLLANGGPLIQTTFANTGALQHYPGSIFSTTLQDSKTGAAESETLGYMAATPEPLKPFCGDSVYRLVRSFNQTNPTMTVGFHANGLEGVATESWGIDNVRVVVTPGRSVSERVVYSTYLGGNSFDLGNAIAVDSLGSVYVAGETVSSNFPATTGALQTSLRGVSDAFVAKLGPPPTTLEVLRATGTYGRSATLQATLASGGVGVAGKTVSFSLNGLPAGLALTGASGVATFSGASLGGINAGTYLTGVQASFAGDASFNASFGAAQLTVDKAGTNVALASSANPSLFGQAVTFTATVSPVTIGTPTGTVTFKDGAATLGTLETRGQTTFTTSALALGTHSITAEYGGDSNFFASASAALSQRVTAPIAILSPAGLVSWWPMDGHAADIVDGNPGTPVNGARFVPGLVGQAVSLDGIDDHVVVPNSANLHFGPTDPMTVDAWLFRTGTAGIMHILGKRTGCGGTIHYQMAYDTNGFGFGGPSGGVGVSGISPPLNTWTHVAATFDGSIFKFYIDGALAATSNPGGTLGPANTEPLKIGASGTCGFLWQGLIDEVDIFNRALTEAEIAAIFRAGSAGKFKPVASPAGLLSWWPMDGHAADIVDGNPGTPVNGARFLPGLVGQAVALDGIDDHVVVPNSANLHFGPTDPMTVDAWLFRTGTAGIMHILGKRTGCGGTIHYQMAYDTNGFGFGGPSGGVGVSGISPPLNTWTHVAATFDGSIFKFYIDGALAATSNPGGTLGPANTEPLKITAVQIS